MYQKHKLDNGITVITRHMDGVRSFAIGVFVKASSNQESVCEIGISHLIEHMMFKGTDKYSAKDIASKMDDIGGSMNAYTSKDCTAYYAKVLYQHADIAIELLSNMLTKSTFNSEELSKEIKVVQEEIAMYEDSPEDVAYEKFQSLIYQGHPLSQPVLGYNDSIEQIDRSAVLDYIKRFYTADHIVISVAGYLPDNLIKQLNHHFADYPLKGDTLKNSSPLFHGGVVSVNKDIEQHHMCLGFEGVKFGHQDHYSSLLLSNYLGGSSSSLLFQKIREENGLAYAIYSHPTFFIDAGHFTIYLSYQSQNEGRIVDLISACLNGLKDSFTEDILARAKMQLKGTYLLGLEGSGSIMSTLGKRAIYGATLQTMDEIIASIDAITLEQVHALIDRLSDSPVALAMVGPIDQSHAETVYQTLLNQIRSA